MSTPKTMKLADVLVLPQLQSRSGGIDADRCQQMATFLKTGGKDGGPGKMPPMKVALIQQEGHKYHSKYVLYGGFHRNEAHIIAGLKEGDFLAVKGTWDEVVREAAKENVEHDASGRYRTSADKRKAVLMYANSYNHLVKDKWPNNRDIARAVAVSHTLVDDIDPFGRGQAVKAGDEGIRDRSAPKKKKKRKAQKVHQFDWKTYDQHVGFMTRGLDAVADIHGVSRESDEFKGAMELLDKLDKQFKSWYQVHVVEKAETEKAKEAEEKAAEPVKAPAKKTKKKAKPKKAVAAAATDTKSPEPSTNGTVVESNGSVNEPAEPAVPIS